MGVRELVLVGTLCKQRVTALFALLVGLLLASVVAGGCSPKSCATNADCGSDEKCQYEIGSCSAQGECLEPPHPASELEIDFCGCNGSAVRAGSGIGYRSGYASGPTTGSQDCTEGASGTDGGSDSSDAQGQGEAGAAGQPD